MTARTDPEISIIWPYWERFAAAQAGLEDMARRYPDHPLEVIIVDDGSPRQPAAGLAAFPAPWPVRVITLPRKQVPKNPCTPLNVGAREARGALLLLTNPETTHRRPILAELRAETLRGPRRWVLAAAWCPELRTWHCHSGAAPAGYHFCAMIRRQDFLDLGGFDERYREGAGYDDADLLERLRRSGHEVVFRDDLVVDHHKAGASIEWPPGSADRNRALYHERWRPPRTLEMEAALQNIPPPPAAPEAPPAAPPPRRGRLWGAVRGAVSRAGTAQAALRRAWAEAAPRPPAAASPGRPTVLQVTNRDDLGSSAALHAALARSGRWSSLGCDPWDLRRQRQATPELLARADVVHLHGLDLWEGLRARLAGRRLVVSIHGDWDRIALPLPPDAPPLIVTSPELLALFPGATYVPDAHLHEAPPPLPAGLPRPAAVIHPRDELGGDLPGFEAFAAAARLRPFAARGAEARPDPARTAATLCHFAFTWLSPDPVGLRLLGPALAAGSVPVVALGPSARAGLAELLPPEVLAALPTGPAEDLAAWAAELAGAPDRLAALRDGLRRAWGARWRAARVVERVEAIYARAWGVSARAGLVGPEEAHRRPVDRGGGAES